MNNIENSSSIKENNPFTESEWSTRDPITNELFFIHKNIIYSQIPNQPAKKLITLNHFIQNAKPQKIENKKNQNNEFNNNEYSIKFSNILSGRNINIYGGGAIATAYSDKILDNFENIVIVKNIVPDGIAYIKFICPISCSNLYFGMCSKKDIENNIFVKKNFHTFKNTTRRNVIMEINYNLGECVFYLNGEYNDYSLKFKEDAIFPCVLIEKKNTSVIVVPSVFYNFSMKKCDLFKKLLILKINVPVVVNNNKELLKYFNSSFNKKIMVKNIFGEINEKGILNNFIIVRIEDKNLSNELKKNFSGICTNKDMVLLKIDEIKFLTKNLTNKIDFSTKSKKIIINKLNSNFELKDENSITQKILNYIIKNFYTIEFIKDISVEKIENIQNEYIKNGEKMFDFMKELKEHKISENSIIDYLNDNDSLLIMKNNKMKILKRNSNSQFDFAYSQEINTEDKERLNIIIKTEDLKYFLTNFNFKNFLYNLPSLSKFQYVRNFFDGLKHSFKINNETILLILYTSIQLFSLIAEYLNTMALITKHQKILELSNKQNNLLEKNKNKNNNNKPTLKNKIKEKEKKELKNFKEINDVLPFANENENDNDNDNISNDSDINFTYEEYSDYIITDTLKFTKIQKIVNEIISQISIRYNESYYRKIFSEGNLFNSFHNLSSFINYPFNKKQNLYDLVDKGFYVENSFSNELKLIDFDNNKLINTDALNCDENIEKYLNDNFPSYLANSSLKNYFRIIDTNYTINNMKYEPVLSEEQINNKDEFSLMNYENFKPLLITVSKKGVVDIYNYKLGLKKLGNFNILVGLKDVNNFSEINEIFWIDNTKLIKNIKDILNNKNFLKNNNNNEQDNYYLNNLYDQKSKKNEKEFKYNEKNFKNLIGMGFSKKSSINALKLHQNNFEKALEYLLENPPLNDNDEKEKEKKEENEKKSKIKIEKWQCEVCTFINEKGDLNCEMCESPIPEKILKEFEEKTKKLKEEEEKKKKSEEEKNKKLNKEKKEEKKKPEIIYKYQNVTILKVHIVFNPKSKDSIAPFLLICNFFDHIKSELIIVVYKLMINPLILKDFLKINNNNIISENITNRQFSSIQNAIQYLNQNYFNNLHTLFPLFLGENKNDTYKHLIPIEETNIKINITSYFDSNYYFENNEIVLNVLVENTQQQIEILHFDISNKFKFDSIFNKSLTIVLNNKQELKKLNLKQEIEKINKDEFLTDIKIFVDNEKILIISKSVFLSVNKKNNFDLVCKKLSEEQIKNFKRINTIYNENEKIIKLEIYDENLKIIDLNLEENNINKNNLDSNNEIIIDLDKINIDEFTENEINSFSENLDFEKVDLNLSKNPNLNGLTKSNKNNNLFNKFYYNSNKINNLQITLNEPKSIISIELNLIFNLKNTNILQNNKLPEKKTFNTELITNSFDETELFKLNNLIPLTVYDFKGAQSKLSINISRMLISNLRFISNYPKPEYIFTQLNQNSFIVDNIIIGSDINPKSTDCPFGEGLIFITNNIENINIAKEKYTDIKYEELKNILKDKNERNEDLFEFDPICYVKMNNEFEYFKTSLYKKRIGKFIYFLPLNGRDGNINKFDTQLMSFLFFGVEGKILNENSLNETNFEEKNNLIDKILGENKIIKNSKIEIFGVKENNEKIKLSEVNDVKINNIIKNNEILGNFYEAKNDLNNENYKKEKFNKIEINLSEISNENFENLSCSFNLISFKNVKSNKNNNNSENNLLLNNFNNLISNSEKFEKFNLILASKISDLNLNCNKRIAILNYLSILFEKYNILSEKILTNIDFINFIKNNLIQSNNDLLSNISFEFLRNCYENYSKIKNIINNNFENILNNLSKLSFTNKGFNQFVNLLNVIKIDRKNYQEKIIHLINKSIEIIKNKNFQIDEQIYLNSYLNINEYPFDYYKFNNDSNLLSKKNSSLIPLFYTCLSDIKNETMTLKIDLKKVCSIEKLKLNFSKNQNNDLFNFKINIFSINNNSEQFEIKSFKFYYDHMWNQLKKYAIQEKENVNNYYNNYYNYNNNNNKNIIEKKEVKFFGSNDFYSLNFNYKSTNNEFETRYILIIISINNSSNENKNFPLNCKIIPVLYGKESDLPNYELVELNKNLNLNISKTLEKVSIDGENYEIKNIVGENSKYLIEYNKKDFVNEKKNDEKEEIILQTKFINDIQKEKENLKKIINKIKENKLYNENKERNKVINLIDSIKNLQNKLNEFNVKSTLEDSLSLNIQILKILVNELNKLFLEKKTNFDLNLNFLQDLLIICVFNEKSNCELENEILKLIKNNFEKIEKDLFNNLVNFYLNKENENINSFSLINTFNKLDFNSDLYINEIKNNFELEKINFWDQKNFKNNFYKISIFIMLLIIKIKNKNFKNLDSNNIYKICIDCINKLINNKEIKIDFSLINLILIQILNLFYEFINNIEKNKRIENIEIDSAIDFFIEILFKFWENFSIKEKLIKIINLLIDPYDLLTNKENDKIIPNNFNNNEKIVITIQNKIINLIGTNINSNENENESNSEKMDFILNLLNKCYTLNSMHEAGSIEKTKNEETIKINNSKIINSFVNYNKTSKIGLSEINNFWKNLTNILEKGNLDMMFYDNNFENLIKNQFLKFELKSQEFLYTQFIKAFRILYKKDNFKLKNNMIYQIFDVINIIIKKYQKEVDLNNQMNYNYLLDFVNNLMEVLLFGEFGKSQNEKDSKLQNNNNNINFNFDDKKENELFKNLFENISNFLLIYFNYSSFSGSVCGNVVVFKRSCALKYILFIISSNINNFYLHLTNNEIKSKEFRKIIKNYLIYLIFNYHKFKTNVSPLTKNVID